MLITEGRRLARPCVFLRPSGTGPVAAIWHECDRDEIKVTGYRCWITVDARFVPGLPKSVIGYLSVFTDEKKCVAGRVEFNASPPKRAGLELRAYEESVLPPIEAVFARGSAAVGDWLTGNNYRRDCRYGPGFPGHTVVNEYERIWFEEYPIYRQDDTYAVLGGWHWPCADSDWYDLVDEQLAVFTIHDSEPWVEGWHSRSGQFKVIQRIS